MDGLSNRLLELVPAEAIVMPALDLQDGKAVRIEVEESGRLSPERLGRIDRRNDLSRLILDVSDALKRQADEKGRAKLIRQCGRRWKAKLQAFESRFVSQRRPSM